MNFKEVIQKLSRIKQFSEATDALKKRTERQWVKCENEDCYSRNRAEEDKECKLSRWILHSFDWRESPEGSDFWGKVHDALDKRENKVKQKKVETVPPVLAMTKQCPTKPGYYWWQKGKKTKMFIAKVRKLEKSDELSGTVLEEYSDDPYTGIFETPLKEIPGYWSNKPIESSTTYA